MKKIALLFLTALIFISITACADEPPSIRVQNARSTKANVQIKTPNNTINQNDIPNGAITNYQDIPEGRIEVTAVIQNENVSPATSFNASNNHNYTVFILNSNPPALRIDSAEK